MLGKVKIVLTQAEFDALPDNQRFLLEQILAGHPQEARETPQFDAKEYRTEQQNEKAFRESSNYHGGLVTKFDPNRRFQ